MEAVRNSWLCFRKRAAIIRIGRECAAWICTRDSTGRNQQPGDLHRAPTQVDFFNGTAYLIPAAFAKSPLTGNGTPLRVGTAPRMLPNVRGPARRGEVIRMSKRFPLYK